MKRVTTFQQPDNGRVGVRTKAIGPRSRHAGYSLLELLVVVSILVAVALIATGSMDGVDRAAQANIVSAEMLEIAKAIKQFKADTGYYPGQGPFALLEDVNVGAYTCANDAADSPGAVDIDDPSIVSRAWFESPANLVQLLERPILCTGHPLAWLADDWDPVTRRGWRGPYLQTLGEGFVSIGDDTNPDEAYETGDPEIVATAQIDDVPGIADPFEHRPVNGLMAWSATPIADGGMQRKVAGRPYLVFLNDYGAGGGIVTSLEHPRIVSMGPDGLYAGCYDDNGDGDCNDPGDGENPCLPNIDGVETDDIILCLE